MNSQAKFVQCLSWVLNLSITAYLLLTYRGGYFNFTPNCAVIMSIVAIVSYFGFSLSNGVPLLGLKTFNNPLNELWVLIPYGLVYYFDGIEIFAIVMWLFILLRSLVAFCLIMVIYLSSRGEE